MLECDIDQLSIYLNSRKERAQVFEIPFHLKDSGEPLYSWDCVKERESILIDLRDEVTKANIRLNRNVHTYYNGYCDVWRDRPEVVSFEKIPSSDWRTSVHHLKKQNRILQITGD